MKGKSRSLSTGPAVLERKFETLLRCAARMRAPGSPRRLRKVSRPDERFLLALSRVSLCQPTALSPLPVFPLFAALFPSPADCSDTSQKTTV